MYANDRVSDSLPGCETADLGRKGSAGAEPARELARLRERGGRPEALEDRERFADVALRVGAPVVGERDRGEVARRASAHALVPRPLGVVLQRLRELARVVEPLGVDQQPQADRARDQRHPAARRQEAFGEIRRGEGALAVALAL